MHNYKRVGIRQSSPDYTLHVNGDIRGDNVTTPSNGTVGLSSALLLGSSDGVGEGKAPPNGTYKGVKTTGSFRAGFSVTNGKLIAINMSDNANGWDVNDEFTLMTIHIGNTGGTSHTDVYHGGKIKIAISVDENNSDNHTQSVIWSQTIDFVALGGGDFGANSKIDYAKTDTLGRIGDESDGSSAFDITLDLKELNSKYYLCVDIRNFTGQDIDHDDTGLLITGDMTLLKGQAHTG